MKNKLLILAIIVLLVSGCGSNEKVEVSGEKINTNKMAHQHCIRNGNAGSDMTVDLQYDIYYTGDRLNLLQSMEKVASANDEMLDKYEKAYKDIHAHYEGLEYYDTNVERTDTTVTSTITINYDKINIDDLIAIEGEEDNIFENKVPKVEKWLALAKKLGATCEEVE